MRRSTIIVLLLAVIAVGAYYFFNNRQEAEPVDVLITPEPSTEVSFLFAATDGIPTSIRIESKAGDVVEVARNAENLWAVVAPSEASADQGLAEAAASQVTALRVLDTIENVDLEVLGLESPEYSILVRFTGDVERKAYVGVVTPSESGYYVRTEQGEIVIVSRDSLDTLLGMLTSPPFAATEVPVPTPTP